MFGVVGLSPGHPSYRDALAVWVAPARFATAGTARRLPHALYSATNDRFCLARHQAEPSDRKRPGIVGLLDEEPIEPANDQRLLLGGPSDQC